MVWRQLLQLAGLRRAWPQYTEDEVARHCTTDSLWLVAGTSVYDVTPILSTHPGGDAALLKRGGGAKDCTRDFAYHSYATRRDIARYKIGELAATTATTRARNGGDGAACAPTTTLACRDVVARTAHDRASEDKDSCGSSSSQRCASDASGSRSDDDDDTATRRPRRDGVATPHDGRFALATHTKVPTVTATTLDYLTHAPAPCYRVYKGTVLQVPSPGKLDVLVDALVVVRDDDGVITQVLQPHGDDADAYAQTLRDATTQNTLTTLRDGHYLLPGLVDLHVHAPQWPQLGKALDRSLESWLHEYTFPLEARYADAAFAATSYHSLVRTLLAHGTTTVAYFATVHLDASVLLCQICLEHGQRAIVGRVAMDLDEQCPAYYRDASPQESVQLTETFVQRVRALPGNERGLVLPAVTPRFIPTCSDAALHGLAAVARTHKCHVLTHCSESDWEHAHVLQRCGVSDTAALDRFGLVTRQTVLAHAVYLSHADMDLVQQRGAAVAHCPLSNAYFAQAVFPLRVALDRGLHVGLGTDISGGPSASLLDTCRSAIAVSRLLESGVEPDAPATRRRRDERAHSRVSHLDAFYAATTGGGIALDLPVGRIAPGYFFDAIVVDTTTQCRGSSIFVVPDLDTVEDVFQKIVYGASASNIAQTYVAGKLVHALD